MKKEKVNTLSKAITKMVKKKIKKDQEDRFRALVEREKFNKRLNF